MVLLTGLVALLLAACTGLPPTGGGTTAEPSSAMTSPNASAAPPSAPSSPTAPSPTAPSPTASPTPSGIPDPVASLTLEQRVGQLFVVGTPVTGAAPATLDALRELQVGGVFLQGRSSAGVEATRALVDELTAAATSPVPLLVATDQEGGRVQVLSGPGFSTIPDALTQGTWPVRQLTESAQSWGTELAAAGVTMDLAPVLDVPDAATASRNAPIGALGRAYGYDAATVSAAGLAVADGMASAGVATVVEHFPGLGLVTANTDSATDVVDDLTDADSPSVQAFASAIDAGAQWVMVSSARYERLDPDEPALFSPSVLGDLLRSGLGFTGVVMTDDVSAAEALSPYSPGDRAVRAIAAGCDVVLVSRDPTVAAEMVQAVLDRAGSDPAFAARVDDAARRVLAAKGWLG